MLLKICSFIFVGSCFFDDPLRRERRNDIFAGFGPQYTLLYLTMRRCPACSYTNTYLLSASPICVPHSANLFPRRASSCTFSPCYKKIKTFLQKKKTTTPPPLPSKWTDTVLYLHNGLVSVYENYGCFKGIPLQIWGKTYLYLS